MYIDLEGLRVLSRHFHKAYGDEDDQYVLSIEFTPDTDQVKVHMSWPLLCNLTKEHTAEVQVNIVDETALILKTNLMGVVCVSCIFKFEILEELSIQDVDSNADIYALFLLWQDIVGWHCEGGAQSGG